MRRRTAGWYPNPTTLGGLRYWDGEWTQYVMWNGQRFEDRTPRGEVDIASDRADADIVRVYVEGAWTRKVLDRETCDRIDADLDALAGVAPKVVAEPVRPQPVQRPQPVRPEPVHQAPTVRTAPPRQEVRPAPKPELERPDEPVFVYKAPAVEPSVAEPSAFGKWWDRTRHTLRGDLAVHGLAYLGVLLLFAGVFGLIAFSFGDVDRDWRGVALVAAPTAFFVAAWYLRRRKATLVAAALTLLGGAILPVVAVASVTDGSNVPPDLHHAALPVTQAVLCWVIAAVYWWFVHTGRATTLRWVTAPTVWLGAGLMAGVARSPIPTGEAVVHATAIQLSVMIAAIAVTVAVASWRPADPVAKAATLVGLPVAAVLFVIELLVAANEGWPAASGVIAAVSGMVIAEFAPRLDPWRPSLQTAFLVAGVLRLRPEIVPGWLAFGALVATLGLVEWTGLRRKDGGVELPLVAAAASASLSLVDPMSGLCAMSLVVAWSTWRRLAPADWLPLRDPYGVVAGAGTVGMTVMLGWRTEPAIALVVAAAVTAATSVLARAIRAVRDDRMVTWWVPASAVAVTVGTAFLPWQEWRPSVAATAALATLAIALSSLPVVVRTWLGTCAGAWALLAVGESLSVDRAAYAVATASLAAAAVMVAALVDRRVVAHIGAMGHLAGFAAIAIPGRTGWPLDVVVGLLAATWWLLTLLHEHGGVAHFERAWAHLVDVDAGYAWLHSVPLLVASAATVATVVLAEPVPFDSPWVFTPAAGAGLALAAASYLHWRRADVRVVRGLAYGAALVGVLGPATLDARWPMIVALALALGTTLLLAPFHVLFEWSAWAVSAPLVVLLVEAAGLSRRWSDLTFAAWGAVVLVGAVVADRVLHGRAAPDEWVRSPHLRAPAVLGAFGFLVGGVGGTLMESSEVAGWIAIAMAAVMLTIALVRPLGALGGVALAVATLGTFGVAPWTLHHPWSLVAWSAALAGLAWATRPFHRAHWAARWDVPAFLLAHAVALVALVLAAPTDSVTITFLPTAALAAAVTVVCRDWRSAPAWAATSALLVIAAAAVEGPGWLALALVAEGAACTGFALTRHGWVREVLLATGALMVCGSWASFTVWRDLAMPTVLVATAAAGATLALVASVALRRHVGPHDVGVVWGGTGVVGVGASLLLIGQPDVSAALGGWTNAAALLVLAVASAIAAPALHPVVRWSTPGLLYAALMLVRYATALDGRPLVLWSTAIALAGAVIAAASHGLLRDSPWHLQGLAFIGTTQLTGVLALGRVEPTSTVLVAGVLLALACEAAALAIVVEQPYVYLVTPAFALAAWLVVAADAFRGEPNWFTAPIGVTALVIVSMARWIRRTRGVRSESVATFVVVTELVAMSVIVAPPLVQTITNLWYSLLAIAFGVLLTGWGAVTRVRRRAAFGAGTVLAAVALLIGVPLAQVVPTLSGPALWLTIAGVGVVAIVAATMIEQGRATVRHLRAVLDEMTHEWEHMADADTAPPVRTEDSPPVTSSR